MSPDLKDVLIATIPSVLPALMVGIGILINKYDITTSRRGPFRHERYARPVPLGH